MASKLAMLVNTEESMARFRSLYQIPPSVSLTYCNSDDFPVINRDEILIPIMAYSRGGVLGSPLHSFLIDFLQTVNATPSQISVNTFRIIMGVIAINRLLDVNLTIREVLAVYQYKCLGAKSNTLSHLVARNVNEKLVNGLPSTNKGFEKDYLRVGGDWFPGSSLCRSEFGQPEEDLNPPGKQGDAELIRRCPDLRLSKIPPRAPYIAQPAEVERPEDFPDRIPTGQVYAMAPPLNPFKLMGKTADAGPSKKRKSQGKRQRQQAPSPQAIHVIVESEQEEVQQSHQKEGRAEPSSIPAEGPSSHHAAWDPALLFGPNPISPVCPKDMKEMGQYSAGRCISPNDPRPNDGELPQGVRSMEAKFYRLTEKFQKKEAEQKKLSELLKAAGDDYTRVWKKDWLKEKSWDYLKERSSGEKELWAKSRLNSKWLTKKDEEGEEEEEEEEGEEEEEEDGDEEGAEEQGHKKEESKEGEGRKEEEKKKKKEDMPEASQQP
uniref:Uncharacterized protein n=1 Tax=Fagus sylvatica TaxID=28930 RepID=A0A2N9FD27_FAGSY